MVIAQQMENGVHCEIAQFPLQGVAELLSLGGCPLQRDAHIAQRAGVGGGIEIVLSLGRNAGLQLEHGEGQHVGGAVHPPHIQIDLMDALVIGEQNTDLAGQCNILRLQRGKDDGFDSFWNPGGDIYFRFQNDLMGHGGSLSLFSGIYFVL